MLLSILFLPLAQGADAVEGGIQAAIFQPGLNFGAEVLAGEVFSVAKSQLGGEYSCYDELGVRDFNLSIPVEEVQADLTNKGLRFQVEFGTIFGENMEIYGVDEDYLDGCVEFDTDLHYIKVQNASFDGTLRPWVENGALKAEFTSTPILTGDIDIDIEDFPDDLVLFFVEDVIWESMADALRETLGEVMDRYWKEGLLTGTFDDLLLDLEIADADVTEDALLGGANFSVNWLGQSTCEVEESTDFDDQEPRIQFGNGKGSSVAMGVTEGNLNRIFRELWQDGFLCFTDDRMDLVYQATENFFDPAIGEIRIEALFNEAPMVEMKNQGAQFSVQSVSANITGKYNGKSVTLMDLRGDLTGNLDLGLDPVLTTMNVRLHDVVLDFDHFEVNHLISDAPNAEQSLQNFIEGWLVGWAARELESVGLFDTQFSGFGAIARADEIRWGKNNVVLFASLYDENDPAVDRVAPETTVASAKVTSGVAVFEVKGADDRAEELAFSVRMDAGSWSAWSADQSYTFSGILPGNHLFEAKARDAWLNEDPSPAGHAFALDADGEDTANTAFCACSVARGSSRGLGFLALLGLLVAVRRKD